MKTIVLSVAGLFFSVQAFSASNAPEALRASGVEPTIAERGGAWAAVSATAAPAAPEVRVALEPAAAPLGALTVRLKDGQVLAAQLLKSDAYFLSIANSRGTVFDVPWAEVAAVDSSELGADLALLRGRITAEPSPVGSIIEARSGSKALGKALWPGFFLHGSGHRYAGDNDTFVSLAGAELFGVVVGGFGLNELLGPGKTGEHKDTALALAVGGASLFTLTWLWDLAFAPGAARRYNESKGLALESTVGGAQVALRF